MSEPPDVGGRHSVTPGGAPSVPAAAGTAALQAYSYAWRLLLLIPAIALVAIGWRAYASVPAGAGVATSIKLTTKPDLAGQARDAYDSVSPTTADLFIVVKTREGHERRLPTFRDTPIGNGLTWPLAPPLPAGDVALVEVWDRRRVIGDKQLDRVAFDAGTWTAKGQTFQLDLLGTPAQPPPWAMPMLYAGATLGALVVLRFVWDQAV